MFFRKLLFKLLTWSVIASMDKGTFTVTYNGKPVFTGRPAHIEITRDAMRGNKGRIEINFNEVTEYLGTERGKS